MALGFLLSYSGTGLMLLLVFLPLAGLRHGRAGLSALLVVMFALGLFATGIIDFSAFSSRVGEFEDTRSSGFGRFVAPFWLAAKQFDTEVFASITGRERSGDSKDLSVRVQCLVHGGLYGPSWAKILHEYGIIGSFILCLLLGVLLEEIEVSRPRDCGYDLFLGVPPGNHDYNNCLCTLSGPGPRRDRIDKRTDMDHVLLPGRRLR